MKRPRSRVRKITVTDELVELFRKAMPAHQAHWRSIVTVKDLPYEEHSAAIDAFQAFNLAAGVKPWEHSPLSARTDMPGLRAALLARCSDEEVKAWDRFSRKYED
jgi:hypothetical protein